MERQRDIELVDMSKPVEKPGGSTPGRRRFLA